VAVALESANKSRLVRSGSSHSSTPSKSFRQLARRIFYSFSKPGAEYLELEDITRYLRTCEEAEAVFALFDKDGNGDVTRDEVEMACMSVSLSNVPMHSNLTARSYNGQGVS
jgi:Ca2+-binding EF-hand superfamily protein